MASKEILKTSKKESIICHCEPRLIGRSDLVVYLEKRKMCDLMVNKTGWDYSPMEGEAEISLVILSYMK